jgi:hypothetical protein
MFCKAPQGLNIARTVAHKYLITMLTKSNTEFFAAYRETFLGFDGSKAILFSVFFVSCLLFVYFRFVPVLSV